MSWGSEEDLGGTVFQIPTLSKNPLKYCKSIFFIFSIDGFDRDFFSLFHYELCLKTIRDPLEFNAENC